MNLRALSGNLPKYSRRQHGAVLVVSLVILLIVTMIAAGSMRSTILEEKMAGNSRDRNLAFQAAESAVREGEMFIENVASLGGFKGSGGLFGRTDAAPDYTAETTWTLPNQHVDASANYGAYEAPQYFIKQFTTVAGADGALNLSGYGDNKGTGDVTVFTVTGRGTGGSADSAEVILRSYYGRIF